MSQLDNEQSDFQVRAGSADGIEAAVPLCRQTLSTSIYSRSVGRVEADSVAF